MRPPARLHFRAMVELLFMMVILKLPILYLAGVCYWAIKAEPKPLEGSRLPAKLPSDPRAPSRRGRPGTDPGPRGGPLRRDTRRAGAARVRSSS